MSEKKKKDIWYCIFILGMLLFLFMGDTIALHFISKNPNPNNMVFGSGEKKEYSIDFLEELSIKDVQNKLETKESFVLLSSRESCETCKLFLPDLEAVFKTYQIHGYYIDKDLIEKEDSQSLIALDERIEKNFTYTPYLMAFKNGKLANEIVGRVKKSELEDFIIQNKIVEY